MVSIIDPLTMVGVSDNPALGEVAQEARAKLQRVVDKLKQ